MSNGFFRLDVSKSRLEILIAFISCQRLLEGRDYSLRDLGRVCGLDFAGVLWREKGWLVEFKIIKEASDDSWLVDFNNVGCVLFELYNTRVLYDFALQFLEVPKELE